MRELIISTGTVNNTFVSGTITVTDVNANTPYSIFGADSVKIDDTEVIVRIPPGDYNSAQKIRYELIGNRLTFSSVFYRRGTVTVSGQQYDSKRLSSTITEYQKQ